MPHEMLQEYVVIDYTQEMVILAVIEHAEREEVAGIGQYAIDESTHTAEVVLVVRDDYQDKGIGTKLLSYLTFIAKKQGLLDFTAEVLADNRPMLHLFESMGFDIEETNAEGVYQLNMAFREAFERSWTDETLLVWHHYRRAPGTVIEAVLRLHPCYP